jgi:malate dehydrogenase
VGCAERSVRGLPAAAGGVVGGSAAGGSGSEDASRPKNDRLATGDPTQRRRGAPQRQDPRLSVGPSEARALAAVESPPVRTKITVVGAGNVGATLAQRVAERDYADVVLVDIVEGLPQGKALDMLESGPIVGYDSMVTGTNGYEETAGSTVVVITSGIPRKPGMSRDDLVMTNAKIVSGVVRQIVERSPDCILIVVANPVDGMTQLTMAVSGFPRSRVIGMAGVLDTARYRTFIAQELDASVHDVQAYVLGGHGDTMVPLTRLTTVAGIPAADLIPAERLASIVQRARDGGAEIVNLLKTGSAYYAPSAAVAQMIDAIVLDTRQVLPCTVHLEGEYGITGLFTGVPCRLGEGGLIEVIDVELTDEEQAALHRSAEAVHQVVEVMDARRDEIDPNLGSMTTGIRIG